MKSQRQSGNAVLIVFIIIVALAILGALGWVYWANFINKVPAATTPAATTSPSTPAASTELAQTAHASYGGKTMTIKYPASWQLVDDGTVGSGITSPDGNVIVKFTLTPPDGIGGTCGETTSPITDPINQATWAAIPGTPQALFSAYISHYLESSSSPTTFYSYGFDAVKNTDAIKNVKAGDSACPVYIFANYIQLDGPSGATMHVHTIFKNLWNTDLSEVRQDLTVNEIKDTFAKTDAQTAEKIIESITLE